MDTKKIAATLAVIAILTPYFSATAALVTCDGPNCTICKFFDMLYGIYDFIVKDIAVPLGTIALIVGGIFMLVSAGSPNIMSKGKTILWSAVIGLFLVFCSFLIINTVLIILGYKGSLSGSISCG